MDRRNVLLSLISGGTLAGFGAPPVLQRALAARANSDDSPLTHQDIANACWIADVEWTEEQCVEVAEAINRKRSALQSLRNEPPLEDVPMPLVFNPSFFIRSIPIFKPAVQTIAWDVDDLPDFHHIRDVVDWTIVQLANGLRRQLFTSEALTHFYSERLAEVNQKLHCVVTLNDGAIETAKERDAELRRGFDRGVLHGIPWGAKDIISIAGMPTAWGVDSYRDRRWPDTATVAKRIEESGAVLLAKLSVGTLAWGDEWFGKKTRNPWDPNQGSSGSSAGSASAVAARACPFAIGTETLGSIVSPTRVCATSGLRPSFGRVSRSGCMTLAWSMDKVGPIANHVKDLELLLGIIQGADGLDPTVVQAPLESIGELDWTQMKVGIPSRLRPSENRLKDWCEMKGASLVPIEFDQSPTPAMLDALAAEAASVHDKLYRNADSDTELGKWGPSFREAQFVTAIEYLHGMRQRVSLIRDTEEKLAKVHFMIGDGDLARMNLTGHPSLVIAFDKEMERERTATVVITGKMFSDELLLKIGSDFQRSFPPMKNPPV